MTDSSTRTDMVDTAGDDWLAVADPVRTEDTVDAPPTSSRTLAVRAGLIVAGAAAGALVVVSVQHGSASPGPGANAAQQNPLLGAPGGGRLPNGQVPNGGQLGGPPGFAGGGGVDGEQHVLGVVVSTGASTLTVRTTTGQVTYAVTSATQVVRDGQLASVSDLQAGDNVLLHVLPTKSGGHAVLERIFAGADSAAGGPPAAPGGSSTTGTRT